MRCFHVEFRKQRGITLIEVLIAAVVLSIGLLGVFQLHIVAKKGSYESFQYGQVAAMASDVMERMRLNPQQLASYSGTTYGAGTISKPDVTCDNSGGVMTNCSDEEMADWDRYLWDQLLAGNSANVGDSKVGAPADLVGCVFVDANQVQVVVSWRGLNKVIDSAASGDDNEKNCGTASAYRRQVSLQSIVVNSV